MIPKSLVQYVYKDNLFDTEYKKPYDGSSLFLVYRFLDKNYIMTYESYCSGRVVLKGSQQQYLMSDLVREIEEVFALNRLTTHKVVNNWWNQLELPYIKMEME